MSLEQELHVEKRQQRELESQVQQLEIEQRSAAKMSFAELSAMKYRDLKVLHSKCVGRVDVDVQKESKRQLRVRRCISKDHIIRQALS